MQGTALLKISLYFYFSLKTIQTVHHHTKAAFLGYVSELLDQFRRRKGSVKFFVLRNAVV